MVTGWQTCQNIFNAIAADKQKKINAIQTAKMNFFLSKIHDRGWMRIAAQFLSWNTEKKKFGIRAHMGFAFIHSSYEASRFPFRSTFLFLFITISVSFSSCSSFNFRNRHWMSALRAVYIFKSISCPQSSEVRETAKFLYCLLSNSVFSWSAFVELWAFDAHFCMAFVVVTYTLFKENKINKAISDNCKSHDCL